MKPLRVFISSVQKELETERLALFSLLTTDPLFKRHVEPVLFEKLPPPTNPGKKPYLTVFKTCQIYVLMIDREYASPKVEKSPTHEEYELACSMGVPSLAMVKGKYDSSCNSRTQEFFSQIKTDGFTYRRFIDRIDLKKEVAAWLIQVLKDKYGIVPDPDVEVSGGDTIEAASTFEAGQQDDLTPKDLHLKAARELYHGMTDKSSKSLTMTKMIPVFRIRGLLWRDSDTEVL